MGTFKIEQDGVTVAVEWPGGALDVREFVTVMGAAAEIHRTVAEANAGELMASAMTYDGSETP